MRDEPFTAAFSPVDRGESAGQTSASQPESTLCCKDWRRSSAAGLLLSPNRTVLRPADASDLLTAARATGNVSLCGERSALSGGRYCDECSQLGSRSRYPTGDWAVAHRVRESRLYFCEPACPPANRKRIGSVGRLDTMYFKGSGDGEDPPELFQWVTSM